jgi:hypothetical protein
LNKPIPLNLSDSSVPLSHLPPTVSPLTVENVLWSNTVLAAGSAVGFVIYTGAETRAVMNTSHPETKVGLLDLEINKLAKVSLLFLITADLSHSSIFRYFMLDSLCCDIRPFTCSRCSKRLPRRVVRLHPTIFDSLLVYHSHQVRCSSFFLCFVN